MSNLNRLVSFSERNNAGQIDLASVFTYLDRVHFGSNDVRSVPFQSWATLPFPCKTECMLPLRTFSA